MNITKDVVSCTCRKGTFGCYLVSRGFSTANGSTNGCFGKNLKLDVSLDRTLPFNPGLGLALGECEPVSPKAGFVGSPGFKVGIFFM